MKQQYGLGSEQQISFKMTNSTSVMVGSFLSYSFVEPGVGLYRKRQHNVAIERYALMLYFKDHKDAKIPHICVAGQSYHPDDKEWIEYIPPSGTVSVKPGTPSMCVAPKSVSMAVMDSGPLCFDDTVLPPLHTPTTPNPPESPAPPLAHGMLY